MEWTITLHEMESYAEIVTRGVADKDGSLAMANVCADTLRKNRIKKLLVDHGNISAASGGVVDVYQRPQELSDIGMDYDVKVAIIVKPEHKEFFSFFETVCQNRGFKFSIYLDRESALEWLLES